MTMIPALLLQSDSSGSGIGGLLVAGITTIVMLALVLVLLAGLWKVFVKAGQPGWAAIVPIYNTYILLQIVGRPAWWLLLMLIPFVNLVVFIIVYVDLAKAFGQGAIFALLILFGIGLLMLGFGDYRYTRIAPAPLPI